MAKTNAKKVVECLRSRDLVRLKAALRDDPSAARSAGVVIEAGRLGWAAALDLLVKNGADINAVVRGYRALHALIQEEPHSESGGTQPQERVECLKWMLAHGADPELLGAWPASRAVLTAAFVGEPAYVEELRRAGAIVDGFVCAALGNLRAVEKALHKDPGFARTRDSAGLTALHCCAGSRLGSKNKKIQEALLAIATLLLDHGADPSATVRSWSHDVDAVYFAVNSGQVETFDLLLTRGYDATAALTPAAWQKEMKCAGLALSHGARIDDARDGEKPLLNQLIRWGQFKQALWLLDRGASPNIPDERGWTAVHQAASRGNEKMLKALLDSGGDPNRRDDVGDTPVDIAGDRFRPKISALLAGAPAAVRKGKIDKRI